MGKKIIPFSDGILVKEVKTDSVIKAVDGSGYGDLGWEIVAIGCNLKDKDYKVGDLVFFKRDSQGNVAQISKMNQNTVSKITDGALEANIGIAEERHLAFTVRNEEC